MAWTATTTTAANVRSGPGTGYPVVTTLPAGSAIDVSSCPGSWCQTQDGFIAASLLAQGGGGTRVVVQPYADNYYGDDFYGDDFYGDDFYDGGFYGGGWAGGGYWGPGWGPSRRWAWSNNRPYWGNRPWGGNPPHWGAGGRPPNWVNRPGVGPRPGWAVNRGPRMGYYGGGGTRFSNARVGGGQMIYRPGGRC
jgi:hypothetical protein